MDVVLNWFTQGVIVAVLTAALLRLIPQPRAQARYGVLWTAYLLVLLLPIIPLVLTIASRGRTVDLVPAVAVPVMTMPPVWWASTAAAVGFWMIWFCLQAVLLGVSVIGVRGVRRRARECPASVLARLPNWSRVSVTGRRTRVILSGEVRAAAVLGCGTPTIAVAPTLIDQLSEADLDRVLVHEWAHVQRRDDLAQLAQRIVRLALGWHPAAWWIEQQLEFEREAACDEVAVSVTGSAKGYATCLAMLATRPESRLRSVAALGASSSRLRERVVRILAAPRDGAGRPWRAATVGGGGGLLACTLLVANLQVVVSTAVAASLPRVESIVTDLAATISRPANRTEPGSRPPTAPRQRSRGNQTRESSPPLNKVERVEENNEGSGESLIAAAELVPEPLQASALPLDLSVPALVAPPVPFPAEVSRTPWTWTQAADVGAVVGRASQDAGIATAGLFRRFGKSLAGAF